MVTLEIEGMSCMHCVGAVRKALSAVSGVTAVEVDLSPGRARVEGSPDLGALLAAVEDEGFTAKEA